ncbi:MAG TPA: DinB family protein [bacterium]|nr:DinB family protein [bacterium]
MEPLRLMAHFNAWANARLYGAVAGLSDADYRRERGLFFGSIHGTLNHLLVVDRLWCGRLEGQDHGDLTLDCVLHDNLAALRAAREAEDARLIRIVEGLDAAALTGTVTYRVILGEGTETVRRDHLLLGQFNHQTYHRGQVVAAMNQDGIEPPPLDVIFYLEAQGLNR